MEKSIKQQSINYVAQWISISLILYVVAYFGAQTLGYADVVEKPLYLSIAFTVVTSGLVAAIWRWVAENNAEMLTTFYSSTNAFRMLLALFTLTICYFVVGQEEITPYVIVFFVFYLFNIGHHAIYFAHITNKK